MTAGKFGGFVVLLHTFLLTHSAVVKAFGANLKNEVAKVSKAAFHTARVGFFFYVFAPGLLFAWRRRNRRLRNNKKKQQQFTELCSRLPSIPSKCRRVAAPRWSVKPRGYSGPCFSCRKLCGRTPAGLLLQSAPTVYHYTRLASARFCFFSPSFFFFFCSSLLNAAPSGGSRLRSH